MKILRFLLVTGMVLGFALNTTTATAAIVDYSGSFVDMTPTPLDIGQTGTITASGGFGNAIISQITGSLPANSMITFTYSFAGTLTAGALAIGGGYDHNDGGTQYQGFTSSLAPSGLSFSQGYVDGSPSTALALSSAQITGTNSATTVIQNFSSGALSYVNLFLGTALGSKDFKVAYAVSAVPLPAALPLFGAGLGALAGFGIKRRKKARAKVQSA